MQVYQKLQEGHPQLFGKPHHKTRLETKVMDCPCSEMPIVHFRVSNDEYQCINCGNQVYVK